MLIMSQEEQNLLKQVEPMLINCWNFNNEEKCYDAKLSLAYYPKEYDGNNPPRIRYTLFMESGREQTNFNCSKQYVDMIDCMTKCIYESITRN
tara:strand:- start:403 stop:681 length:279 start_codon:yes stop_codon:yes gene_type:complete